MCWPVATEQWLLREQEEVCAIMRVCPTETKKKKKSRSFNALKEKKEMQRDFFYFFIFLLRITQAEKCKPQEKRNKTEEAML